VLFYRVENLGVRKFQAGTGKLESQKIERLGEVLRNEDAPVEPEQIGEQAGLSRRKVTTMLNRLEEVGAVERLASGEVQLTENTNLTEAAQAAADEQARRKEESDRRIQQMQAYAELTTCRRQFLLQYFGDDLDEPCGNCDNCEGNAKRIQGSSAVSSGVGTRREVTG
jgi:ATP-dependent DNA helicase RecQ